MRSAATRARAAARPGEPGADDAHVGAPRAPRAAAGAGWSQGEERRAGGPGTDELAAGECVVHGREPKGGFRIGGAAGTTAPTREVECPGGPVEDGPFVRQRSISNQTWVEPSWTPQRLESVCTR